MCCLALMMVWIFEWLVDLSTCCFVVMVVSDLSLECSCQVHLSSHLELRGFHVCYDQSFNAFCSVHELYLIMFRTDQPLCVL